MAKPNQAKEVKPKTEDGASKNADDGNKKLIVTNLATTVLICMLFITINYVLLSSLVSSKLGSTATTADTADGNSDEESSSEIQKGIILDLGDFVLNLSDTSPRKYLKANVALEVSRTPNDPDPTASASKEGGKEGGESKEGGKDGAGGTPVATEMEQYKPAIRD